jgi:hypothetical protein
MEEVSLTLKGGELVTCYQSSCGCVHSRINGGERWVKQCDFHKLNKNIIVDYFVKKKRG